MTDDRDPGRSGRRSPEDDPDDGDDRDGSTGGPGSGPGGWLSALFRALESLDRLSGDRLPGRGDDPGRRERTSSSFDVAIRSGLDSIDPGPGDVPRRDRDSLGHRPTGHPKRSRDERARRSGGDDRDRRSGRSRPSSNHHVTTRDRQDELLVTADVSGVDEDDVTVGFADDALVVRVAGRELERVDVPWTDRTAEAAVRNGVLTVSVRRGASGDADSDPESERETGTGSGRETGAGSGRDADADDHDLDDEFDEEPP